MEKKKEIRVFWFLMLVFIILLGIFTYKTISNIDLLTSKPCVLCEENTGQKCYEISTYPKGTLDQNFNYEDIDLTEWQIKVIE